MAKARNPRASKEGAKRARRELRLAKKDARRREKRGELPQQSAQLPSWARSRAEER